MSNSSIPILPNAALDHERFSAHRELEALLKRDLRGEVKFDLGARALYASDSSNYRQLPIGVVFPRDAADVEAALAVCRATGAAVLPRGAGTSLAGQCVNVAVVFDYSRHMNALAALEPERKLATVEPGIVLDRLREAAEVHHLTYAPDPATHSRCTLGGILGNNSCGVHGLLGGKAVDNVHSMDVVLYDGTRMTVGPTSPAELEAIIRAGGRKGEIYAGLKRLRDRYGELVRQRFPRIPRRVSGYNLDELLPESSFNVARALVGSEGTCVNIVSATLNLTASPQHRILVVLGFSDAFLAADAVPLALEHKPIGLEGFDHLLVDFMRRKGLALRDLDQLPEGMGFLLFEVGANSPEEAREKAESIAQASQSWPSPPVAHICTPEEAAAVWRVRESALGAMVFVPGEPDRFEGWEDAAVPPEKLGAYLRAITALMAEYGFRSPLYGHYGQGCVHMRINFDFRSAEGLRRFREFIERAADVVVSFGGSFSGEHGDGQSRAILLPKMFGPELVGALREFKALWDPANRMNPGKLSDAVRVYDPTENLRFALPSVSSHAAISGTPIPRAPSFSRFLRKGREATEPDKHFVFAADQGSLERAAERCVGVGACRNTKGGVMCPSYRATGEEQYSTRGRAHLLWEMLAGALRQQGFRSQAVLEALDLCLSCKACKSECPVQVDMAQYKAEFLAQHYKGRPHPIQHYIFAFADKMARLGSLTPALTNAVLTGPFTSPLVKRIAGVAAERQLPRLAAKSYQSARSEALKGHDFSRAGNPASDDEPLAPEGISPRAPSFRPLLGERVGEHESGEADENTPDAPSLRRVSGARMGEHKSGEADENTPGAPSLRRISDARVGEHESKSGSAGQRVLLWPDTWNNYYHPSSLAAAEALLTEAGFAVEVPTGHICCGRALYDFGFLTAARAYLAHVLDRMAPQIDAGLPFVFLEPSCASVFKDELPELFPNHPRARRLRDSVWLLADWLAEKAPQFAAGRLQGRHVLVHGHCHHKAVFGGPASEVALLRKAGAEVELIQAGCCGMAGPFGFEAAKFEVSKKIASDGLLPAVASAAPDTLIVADGFSCREQIEQLGGRQAVHFAEALAGENKNSKS